MAASAPLLGVLAIAPEDPHGPDSLALFDEMSVFVNATYPEDDENGITPTTTEELARDGVLLVARVDGVAAGSGALMPHPPVEGERTMEIKRMLVRPAYRGQGLSKMVLQRLEQIAASRGATRLVLMCGPRQPAALMLYERSGYSVRKAYGKHADHPLSIFFEKRLPANDGLAQP